MKKLICLVLAIILSFEGSLIVMASNTISDDISIENRIVSDSEYINLVAAEENISYSEAERLIYENRKAARIDPESVVILERTVTKKVNRDFELKCTAFLEVLRDNAHRQYIEILSIKSPNVSLVGTHVNASMGSAGVEGKVESKTEAKVYCNGSIQYSISTDVSASLDPPGYSIGGGVGTTENYVYDVNSIFHFYL